MRPSPSSAGRGRPGSSILARLVLLIGLSFLTIELVLLAVFTAHYWESLRGDRRDQLARHAAQLREQAREALAAGVRPPDDAALDAQLGAALAGQGRPEGPQPLPLVPASGAPVDAWVITRDGLVHQLSPAGHLLPTRDSEWPAGRPLPAGVRSFLDRDGQLFVALEEERPGALARTEPLFTSGTSAGPPDAVLYLETSLRDLQAQVVTYGLAAFGAGAVALMATAMLTIWYLRRALLLPLGRMIAADNAARRGDHEGAVVGEELIPDDEVGAIMRSRNRLYLAMTGAQRDLDRKNDELRAWGRELERLVEEKTGALLRARDSLYRTEKLAALGRLAANVAHEINNPLASIAGYAEEAREELRAGGAEHAEVARALKTIEEQAFRCKEILKRLLGLARADRFQRVELELGRLVRETVEVAEPGARRRGVELRLELPLGDGPVVDSDAASLQQVILNLVENALDAAPAGGGPPWVAVGVREVADEVVLAVSDSGRGIPPAIRERVFDPFYTTKPVGRGTGLGLAICQSLVERLGGRIEVLSDAPDRGATFSVVLPRQPLAAAPTRGPAPRAVDRSDALEAQLAGPRPAELEELV